MNNSLKKKKCWSAVDAGLLNGKFPILVRLKIAGIKVRTWHCHRTLIPKIPFFFHLPVVERRTKDSNANRFPAVIKILTQESIKELNSVVKQKMYPTSTRQSFFNYFLIIYLTGFYSRVECIRKCLLERRRRENLSCTSWRRRPLEALQGTGRRGARAVNPENSQWPCEPLYLHKTPGWTWGRQ